ncbi:MAG: GtrA family protein [Erysipelotrichaceae bacterium]|nr:GtrA family protein [Erysipelotrichaceae bacterium]
MKNEDRNIRNFLNKYRTFIRFGTVGLSCAALDIWLYWIFTHVILKGMEPAKAITIATIIAKAVSSFTNFLLNKNGIFDSQDRTAIIRYYIMIMVHMFISAKAISFLYELTKIDSSIIKMFVDLLLFFAGYNIQKLWVFPNKNKH